MNGDERPHHDPSRNELFRLETQRLEMEARFDEQIRRIDEQFARTARHGPGDAWERRREALQVRRQELQSRFDEQRQRLDERFEQANRRAAERASEQHRIVSVALDVLDEVGLDDLTLRKLAVKLGLKAPTLYWYFQNKAELIDYMAENILHTEFATLEARRDDETWQAWFTAVCHRLRTALTSRRDGARVVVGVHFDPGRTLMKVFEITLQSLSSAGVDVYQARVIMLAAIYFVMTWAIEEQSGPTPEQAKLVMQDAQLAAEFPLLFQMVNMGQDEPGARRVFDDALRRIIIGDPSTP